MRKVESFADVIGGEKLIAYMREAAASGQIPHAVMLVGEEGSGKKMFARLFAKALECEEKRGDPCLVCQACRQVSENAHPDLITIGPDAEKARPSIPVKTIREAVTEDAVIKPYKGPYKIYIIDRAETMTEEAQNALLKTLEEPPAYVIIILLARDEDRMLETVRSRCVIFRTGTVPEERVKEYLQRELMAPDYKAGPAAMYAQGNPGKAAALLANEDFAASCDEVAQYFKKARYTGYDRISELAQETAKDAGRMERFLELTQLYLRDILTILTGEEGRKLFYADREEELKETAKCLSYRAIDLIQNDIYRVKERVEQNVAADMALELLLTGIKEKML